MFRHAAIEGSFNLKRITSIIFLFPGFIAVVVNEAIIKWVVSRSKKVKGSYLDKNGVSLAQNGGTLIVQGNNKEWFGAGYNSAYTFDGNDYII